MEILILSQLIPLFIGFENSINNGIFFIKKNITSILINRLIIIYILFLSNSTYDELLLMSI